MELAFTAAGNATKDARSPLFSILVSEPFRESAAGLGSAIYVRAVKLCS